MYVAHGRLVEAAKRLFLDLKDLRKNGGEKSELSILFRDKNK